MTQNRLIPGKFVELKEDVNAIPAGVYRLDSIVDGSYQFSVGRGATPSFMLFGNLQDLLRPLPYKEGKRRKTSTNDFINNYYELLNKNKDSNPIFDPTKPFSCAFLSPEQAREVN